MVTTIQNNRYFFCHWKMDGRINIRLVIMQNESIFYFENELPTILEFLKKNLEKLQIKSFSIDEITFKPHSIKARKPINSEIFIGDIKHIERDGSIL
jgi:hypothetical protein